MSSAFPLSPRTLFNYLAAKKALDSPVPTFPWYDSGWLYQYVAAKMLIERVRPKLLSEFMTTFDCLRTDPKFEVRKLDRVFNDEVMIQIRETIRSMPADANEYTEIDKFGRIVVHNHPFFTYLQKTVLPLVSELAGELVEPSYNFLSLYSKLGVCEPHMDAPDAKWTLDLCIEQSDAWPIHFSRIVPWPEQFAYQGEDWQTYLKQSSDLQFRSFSLEPNEAVLFSGSSQWHYRDSFPGDGFCHLLFFHYIPKGMDELVRPANWPRVFDIPELARVVGTHPKRSRVVRALRRAAKRLSLTK